MTTCPRHPETEIDRTYDLLRGTYRRTCCECVAASHARKTAGRTPTY